MCFWVGDLASFRLSPSRFIITPVKGPSSSSEGKLFIDLAAVFVAVGSFL
jgi:hypothetical protein